MENPVIRRVRDNDYVPSADFVAIPPGYPSLKIYFKKGKGDRTFDLVRVEIDGFNFVTLASSSRALSGEARDSTRPSCNHIPSIRAMQNFDRDVKKAVDTVREAEAHLTKAEAELEAARETLRRMA